MCSVQFYIHTKGDRYFEHKHTHNIKHAIINTHNNGYHGNILSIFCGSKSSKTWNGNIWITQNWNQKFTKTHLWMSSINDNLISYWLLPIIHTLNLPECVRGEYVPDPPLKIWGRSEHFTVMQEVKHAHMVTVFSWKLMTVKWILSHSGIQGTYSYRAVLHLILAFKLIKNSLLFDQLLLWKASSSSNEDLMCFIFAPCINNIKALFIVPKWRTQI